MGWSFPIYFLLGSLTPIREANGGRGINDPIKGSLMGEGVDQQ